MIVAKNPSATPAPGERMLLEKQLEAELVRLERSIKDLQQERETVLRLWQKVRSQNVAQADVTRRNSAKRVLVEHAIKTALAEGRDGASAATLIRAAKASVPDLKPVTFRSHLHRLKQKGAIIKHPRRLHWWLLAPGEGNNAGAGVSSVGT